MNRRGCQLVNQAVNLVKDRQLNQALDLVVGDRLARASRVPSLAINQRTDLAVFHHIHQLYNH